MKQVFITLSPVSLEQTVTVFENGKSSSTMRFRTSDLEKTIFSIADIDEIILIGSKTYTKRLEQKLKKYETTKYGASDIKYKFLEN